MDTGLNRLRRTAAACGIGLLFGAAAAAGDDASPWDGDARSAVRLIAGSSPAARTAPTGTARAGGATVRAGLEIRLAAG